MDRKIIVNVNLEYDLPEKVKAQEHLDEFLFEVDLPDNYVEGSIDMVKIFDEETQNDIILPD